MQLSGVPVPRIWVEATSKTDHLSDEKSGTRPMSGPPRLNSKIPARLLTKATFLLAWVVLLGIVACQGALLDELNVGKMTSMTSEATEDPSSFQVHQFYDDPDDTFWIGHNDYDTPMRAPGLTDEEFQETWHGAPNTLKIGILMPFTPNPLKPYRTTMSRINLSVLRMAARDMNDRQVIPGMNISLVLRDSQRLVPNTNVSGGASAIAATTRLLSMDVAGVIGDVASELTAAEALMTSSVGIPQCAFSSYNMDSEFLSNFTYLFRTAPTVMAFVESLTDVIQHYGWRRISVLHTSDVTGLLGEKLISELCQAKDIDVLKSAIQLPQEDASLTQRTQSALRTIQYSDTRIHILIAARTDQVGILDIVRNLGLFQKDHVWLTPVDLSDSLILLNKPSDFNGLIMADVLWKLPGTPVYDNFFKNWINLDPAKYPLSGSTQLTWHETFAYTCLQVIVEAYGALVKNTNKIANETEREELLAEIKRGQRSQDLTIPFLRNRTYNSPAGALTLDKDGNPTKSKISILSFQHNGSVPNGQFVNGVVTIFNPIVFKDGTTKIPEDAPEWDELNPQSDSAFGLTIIILTSILLVAIISTAVIVIVNRDNIIIKSASPLFCILELVGLALTLSWIYLRADVPSPGICRTGLMVLVIGLTVNLSALVVKNYRIYRIFNSVSIINHAVSNKYLLRVVSIPVIITLIPCIVHCFVNYLTPDLIRTSSDQFWVQCASDESQFVWDVVIGVTPGVLTLFGVYLAFKTRNVTRLWNEARAIATTIYIVTFFVIIIIIVQTFTQELYQVTYHVTIVCVFVASFLEYCILFIPKLRNLWLQKRGLHVPAGRDDYIMDSVLGGINAPVGRRRRMSNASHLDEAAQDDFAGDGEKRRGSAVGMLSSQRRSSDTSEAQPNMNISDLVSSYPFGQINNDHGTNTITSPVHRPTIYGHSNLSNRGQKTIGTQDGNMYSLDLSETAHPLSSRSSIPADGNTSAADGNQGETPQANSGGYGIFGGNQTNATRSSRDTHPFELHEILLASSNSRTSVDHSDNHRPNGMLTVNAGNGGGGGLDFLVESDRDPYSRKSSFGDFDHSGPGRIRSGAFTGALADLPRSRSPKLYPLHNQSTANVGHGSIKSGLRETRMDSYTVVVPVQRQRWYIMKVLAQWRMSKVIFVPYSKLLVIVDLETEKSSSLILHSIEAGYSPSENKTLEISSNGEPLGTTKSVPLRSQPPTALARNSSDQSAITIEFLNQVAPAAHLSPVSATETRLASGDTTGRRGSSADTVQTPSNPTTVNTSAVQVTTSGVESVEAHPSLRRRASQQMMSSVKNMTLNLGLDIRQMDGITPAYGDTLAGIEEGIQTDYVIRVISIHNECWKVQLPDQETMDRWVDIGRQIKDDNWIARPINGSRGLASARREPSDGPSSGGTEEDSNPSNGSAIDQRRRSRPQNRTFHPLQHQSNGDSGQNGRRRLSKDDQWMSDVTDSSTASNETDRQVIRERAARMNQQLKASNKFPSVSLRGLHPESIRSRSSSPTMELPQMTSVSDSPASRRLKKPATHSSLSRIMTLPSALNEYDDNDANAAIRFGEPSTAMPSDQHHDGNLDSSLFSRRRTEGDADLSEILAETNIAYSKGQHAVYDDNDPAMAHRSHRFFNNIQYNYNRGRLHDDEVPQSPEWHLTTLELAEMESERTLTSGVRPDLLLDNGAGFATENNAEQNREQRRPSITDPILASPVPTVSVTAPPETLPSPLLDPLPPSEPLQDSQEASRQVAPTLNRLVSMSPMVMHLPPTFPEFSSPGEGGMEVSEDEEWTSGLREGPQTPAQLLDHNPSQDHAIAGAMLPTAEDNSDTGRQHDKRVV